MIVIKGLDIGYKNKLVHASIDLELQAGKSYALIGENGVGKSTLLKSITGVKSFNRGEISLQNQNLQSLSLNQLSKLVSVVFTTRPNLGDFTVGEVVKMGRIPHIGLFGKHTQEDREIVISAMEFVGIETIEDQNINALSDGQFQKVMIAKAVAQNTPIIILDEPSSFLDINSKIQFYEQVKALSSQGKLILLSTHEIIFAQKHIDYFILMTKDTLKTIPAKLLFQDPLFQDYFPGFSKYIA